jgi:nucleoside-diphosphate-sugar epimerase
MMEELHVVVGAGPIGSSIAEVLASQGRRVRVVTRSGGAAAAAAPARANVEQVVADAGDGDRMAELCGGAAALYNAANPRYHRWPVDWPPIARSLLAAAEASGAVLVTVANLYGYGAASASLGTAAYDTGHPMTEQTPLAATGTKGRVRAQMWLDALAAHDAGRLRAVEVRASDYIGPRADSVVGERLVPRLLQGRSVTTIGRTDRLHTWTYTLDVARTAVAAGARSDAHGRAWHVPSNAPRTQRQVAEDLAAVAGAPVRLRAAPRSVLHVAGVFSPVMRELRETEYQFCEDFVMDSTAAEAAFGFSATPWEEVLHATLQSYGWERAGAARAA